MPQNRSWNSAPVAMLALLQIATALNAFAEPNDPENSGHLASIEKITNEIVRAEIQLMQFSTRFHAAWVKPDRFKSWRIFAYKMADSSLTNAGMITIAASRFKYSHNPAAAPRSFLKAGHIVNLTAASILVGGTLTERLLDHCAHKRIAAESLDPKSVLKTFCRKRDSLDALLAKRKSYLEACRELSPIQKQILEADGAVLQDLRDLAAIEFKHSYTDVTRLGTLRNLSDLTTLAAASNSGYLGSLNALLAVANRDPKQVGVAGLGFICSGATVVVSPLITLLGSRVLSKPAHELKAIDLTESRTLAARFDQHRDILSNLIAKAEPSEKSLLEAIDARCSVYRLHNAILDARHEMRLHSKASARRELGERLFFSSIVGGTNIARGSQLAVAGFHYYDFPNQSYRLVASASTGFIAGTGVWTADNVQGKIRDELRERKLKKAKLSVHAQLITDLEDLQDMDNQMSVY